MPDRKRRDRTGGIEIISREEILRVHEILNKVKNKELPLSVLNHRGSETQASDDEDFDDDDDDVPVLRFSDAQVLELSDNVKLTRASHASGASDSGTATVTLGNEGAATAMYDLSNLPVSVDKVEFVDDPQQPGHQQIAVTGRMKEPTSTTNLAAGKNGR